MKFLPSSADMSLHAWVVPLVTLAAALLPAAGIFIWAAFFRKRGRPRRRKRRTNPASNRAITRTNGTRADGQANGTRVNEAPANGAAPVFDPKPAPGEPKS